jgi:uncharacterized membrane protein YgcG
MTNKTTRTGSCFALSLLIVWGLSLVAYSQDRSELRGTITDQAGALVVGVDVTLTNPTGQTYKTKTNDRGEYRITAIAAEIYTLTVSGEGFATFTKEIDLTKKLLNTFDITMEITVEDKITVNTEDLTGVSVDPSNDLMSINLSPEEIRALPDDPDDMLTILRQMAGATEDAQIYVDGYRESGRLPPKEAILAIRINSNPFSAQYTEPGFGRIEIITKPGSNTFHGGIRFNFDDQNFNARNAFALLRTPLSRETYNVFLTGPIIKNKWDFFVNFERRDIATDTAINATILNPTSHALESFVTSVAVPQTLNNVEIRTHYLVDAKNNVGVWYRHTSNVQDDQGIGGFSLPSQAFRSTATDNTLRISLTTVATESSVNEIRTEFSRRTANSQASDTAPQVSVVDAFTSGGDQGSLFNDSLSNNFAFSDDATYTHKKHTFKFGFRADGSQIEDTNEANFGGSFTFSGVPATAASPQIAPLTQYRDVLLGMPGIHPTQFSVVEGDPFVGLTQWDFAWYINDDWKPSKSLNVSFGLRQEFQTHLGDQRNLAPRLGLALSPDKDHKSVIRLGSGIFYTIVTSAVAQAAVLGDGVQQRQLVLRDPDFFSTIPTSFTGFSVGNEQRTLEDLKLRMPYVWITTLSYERALPLKIQGSIAYTYQRGDHLLREVDLNQPSPFSITATNPIGIRPDPSLGPVLDVQSTGISKRSEMRITVNRRLGKILVFGNYLLSSTDANTSGWTSVAADSANLAQEWGRTSYDYRNRGFVGGSVTLPYGITAAPYVFAQTGGPFNIVTGSDQNGDFLTLRPAFAAVGVPNQRLVSTPYGIFNLNPFPGEMLIPRNFGQAPGSFNVNLNLSKAFGFGSPLVDNTRRGRGQGGGGRGGGGGGGRGGGGGGGGGQGAAGGGYSDSGRKYTLTVYAYAQNLLNHVNLAGINGDLTSPVFGLPETAAAARVITMGIHFNF